MTELKFNFQKTVGKIKPMHAVGQPPLKGLDSELFKYLTEANVPYSRLHDVGGWFGKNMFVDIPNIFRDFDKDETDPENYDFTFTDILITELIKYKCEPYFRLGVTIENFHEIKKYRCLPPKDNKKWARICEHIIRHYNEGWADGFHYNIKYWEIWNEPDSNHAGNGGNGCWAGTSEEFFDLYRVTSKHLRECFGDTIKICGYGHCGFYAVVDDKLTGAMAMGSSVGLNKWEIMKIGFIDFFEKFVKMVKDENLPFDFFSHHSYSTAGPTLKMHKYAEDYLESQGLPDVEIHLNEWNPNPTLEQRGTSLASANVAAMMSAMQDTKMQVMCYYDAQISQSVYGGLFNPMTHKPLCTYYSIKAFGNLYAMGNQVEVVGAPDGTDEGVYVTAATGNGLCGAILTNIGEDEEIVTNLGENTAVYLIDQDNFMTPCDINPGKFTCQKNKTYYFEFKKD